ncbi:MAG: CDP-diacylglycerol--glycerol-3-phosphate 3-phosphatidyltransferase [Clostridia bacterium]|nr:CDP-diacylglycerol--glycerol-3-phosphate 3-phosphatidyltransferase [Clostridia bacterium]MBR3819960.1 CDP-diacylglycerol--glycerol-3-phosphate 3-phosphatidyltransferase [Clostridia bacterium]
MNLPNKLTVLRMILTPFYLAAMLIEFRYHYLVALIIFAVASITDFLDGNIARKNNLVTTFGKLCDPVADKMLTTAALLAFMQLGLCNIWVVMIILTREFLVTSFRLVASAQGVVIPAGILGKIKTVSQMVFSIVIMLGLFVSEFVAFDFDTFSLVSNIFLWITAVLTVVSGIKYIVDGKKVIDFSE